MREVRDSREKELQIKDPLNIIFRQRGSNIVVYLKTGEKYTGILEKADTYMNLLLRNATEDDGNKTTRYGRALIRGNNILIIKVERL